MEVERMNSLGIAIKSIRANLVPMAVLWLLAALTVWGYYRLPPFAAILEPLAKWQRETGWPAAVVNRTVFCGLLPGVFLLTVRSIRPLNSLFFYWEGRDFSLSRCRAEWPRSWLREIYLPVLLADFCVWIPVQFAVYMFPLPLQIQLVGFAGCFWSLVGLSAGVRVAKSRSACATRAS